MECNEVQCSIDVSGVKGLWLEMAIVADHTMMKFHGRERVKHYILALMNIVSIYVYGVYARKWKCLFLLDTFACMEAD